MATDLTLRNEKGETLTFSELDSNFLALDSSITNTLNNISSLDQSYVTLGTNQTIVGDKNFIGALSADSVSLHQLAFRGEAGELGDSAIVSYDPTHHVLQVMQDGIQLDMGSTWFYFKTDTAVNKGQVLYLDSAENDIPVATLADATDVDFNRDRVLGFAVTSSSAGDYGYCLEDGILRDVDTSGFIVGDTVYLDNSTAGGITKTAPTASPSVELGIVTRADASTGQIHTRLVHIDFTDDVDEGSTNLYYTSTRVDSDIDERVTKSFVDALGVNAASVDGFNGIGIYDSVGTLLNGV
jgi:hypothetical protein